MCRCQRHGHRRRPGRLPPVEFFDTSQPKRAEKVSVAQRCDDQRVESPCQHPERPHVAMVVMIVTQQNDRDRWQRIEWYGGRTDAPRANEVPRPRAIREHRIRQNVSSLRLNEKRRMANERDDGARGLTLGYRLWRV